MIEVTELRGDGIGPELRERSTGTKRRATGEVLYDEAERSLRATRLALKYPTETRHESPNAVLRRRLGLSVIHRPVCSIPGIESNFKPPLNLHVIRVATGGTYEDPGRPIGRDAAVSLRIVERAPCREAALFAFRFARERGLSVTSSSKHTIQRVTDGLFESVAREVATDFPEVEHRVELFDALLGKIVLAPQDFQVVLCLNEYGDFLSDMACGLAGSLGTGASGNHGFGDDGKVDVALFDPAGGTAPDIAGQNLANPTAALFALGMLLDHAGLPELCAALRLSLLAAIAEGKSTPDVGGELSTRAFVDVVTDRL